MDSIFNLEVDLIVTLTAVFVAGMAAVLGIWMERDPRKPPRYAWALSALILLATGVSLMQSVLDKREQEKVRDDMARLLTTMERMASESDDPELLELVKSELNAQSRSNPEIVEKVAQRVSDEGRDAGEVLGKHLGAADMEKVTRKGVIKAKETDKREEKPAEPVARTRRPREDEKGEVEAAPAPERSDDSRREAAAAARRAAAAEAAATPTPTPTPVAAPTPPPVEAVAAPVPPATAVVRKPPADRKPVARKPAAKKPAPKKPAR